MADFLLELLSEAIPARMQARARNDLARLFAEQLDFLELALILPRAGEKDSSEQEHAGVERYGAQDAERPRELHFLSVLIPTLAIPILRTSSRTATTYLKSAPASLLMMTLASLAVDLSVWSLSGNCAIVIDQL